MNSAVTEFLALPPTPLVGQTCRGGISSTSFAKQNSIPASTFVDRLASEDPLAPRHVGRPAIISPEADRAVADAVAQLDENNRGRDTHAIMLSMNQTFPALTPEQIKNHWQHKTKRDSVLTAGRVTAEPSSQKRTSAINEMDQRYWFLKVATVRKDLSALSIGTYNGQTYDQLRAHFIFGSDEEGVQASFNCKKMVGRRDKKEHTVKTQDSRLSNTALRTGNAAGVKGPSVYIVAAAQKPAWLTTTFLEKLGAPTGSIPAANKTAYMTDELWDEIVEDFCKALRSSDEVVRANPNWWIEYHIDGFHAKVSTPKGQDILRKYHICAVQSPGQSSQVTQVTPYSHTSTTQTKAFDDVPAVTSKCFLRTWYQQRDVMKLTCCPLYRLPRIRESISHTMITDLSTLLTAMVGAEQALTGAKWVHLSHTADSARGTHTCTHTRRLKGSAT